MNPNLIHNPRTHIERQSQRQLWVITLICFAVLLIIGLVFFTMMQT